RKQSSTKERYSRARRIKERGLKMTFRCERCEKKRLRCFVDTASGRCAGCIAATAECSLFIPEEEWERVGQEKGEKRLELARIEEAAARVRRELLELEAQERKFARRDLAVLKVQDQAQESESSSTVVDP
ncbi:hypothetical protein M011DRAFT_382221, partial [Sporormia fimetaria CBS 119925]